MHSESVDQLTSISMPEQRFAKENWNRKVSRWRMSEDESRTHFVWHPKEFRKKTTT